MYAPEFRPLQTLFRLPLATIDQIVSERLGTTRVQGNAQPAVFNRQIAMYLAKHVGGWSTTRIGKFYNGRHHTTLLWALKRIERLRATDPRIDELLSFLGQEIQSQNIENGPMRSARLRRISARLVFPFGPIEELLDSLADRIVERIKSRGLDSCLKRTPDNRNENGATSVESQGD